MADRNSIPVHMLRPSNIGRLVQIDIVNNESKEVATVVGILNVYATSTDYFAFILHGEPQVTRVNTKENTITVLFSK